MIPEKLRESRRAFFFSPNKGERWGGHTQFLSKVHSQNRVSHPTLRLNFKKQPVRLLPVAVPRRALVVVSALFSLSLSHRVRLHRQDLWKRVRKPCQRPHACPALPFTSSTPSCATPTATRSRPEVHLSPQLVAFGVRNSGVIRKFNHESATEIWRDTRHRQRNSWCLEHTTRETKYFMGQNLGLLREKLSSVRTYHGFVENKR